MAKSTTVTKTKTATKTANTKTKKTEKTDGEKKEKRAPTLYQAFVAANLPKWNAANPDRKKEGMAEVARMWRESDENPNKGQAPKEKKPKEPKTKEPKAKKATATKSKPKSTPKPKKKARRLRLRPRRASPPARMLLHVSLSPVTLLCPVHLLLFIVCLSVYSVFFAVVTAASAIELCMNDTTVLCCSLSRVMATAVSIPSPSFL
ncbi:HMG box domain-containing protein [Mycena venus]|uniref:HMG box domain-containing protein n=1 Tax=Mycena venus TaxID=2733690 RepID=A0A8H6U3V2_9AGAR|nr:HMG box domain-containing protein [Mycena venus]